MGTLIQVDRPLPRTTLAEAACEAILENILSGALASGTELNEQALAQDLHVSRTPVREALARLQKDGLVVSDPQRKLRVASFTPEEVAEIYEMRGLLESAAAERAAGRVSKEVLAGLRRTADALRDEPDGGAWNARALEFDLQFHDAIARAAGNSRLRADIGRYRLLVRAFCRITGSPANLRRALAEHLRVIRALEARDPAKARDAMAAHIRARALAALGKIRREKP